MISGYFAVATSQAVAEPRELTTTTITAESPDQEPIPTATPRSTTVAALPPSGLIEPTPTPVEQPAEPTPESAPVEAPPPEPEPTVAPIPAAPAPKPEATATPRPPAPTATPKPAAPAPPPATSVALTDQEQQLLALHNKERAAAGLAPLQLDATLTSIARARATDMATFNYFSHTSPSGVTAFTLINSSGYAYSIGGENIARNNYPTDQSVSTAMVGFMTSASHRANILEARFTQVGIAIVIGADNMRYYAVVFAGR